MLVKGSTKSGIPVKPMDGTLTFRMIAITVTDAVMELMNKMRARTCLILRDSSPAMVP